MQKNAYPNKAQMATMKRAGLNPLEWVVVRELTSSLIIKKRGTDEYQIVKK